MNLKVPYTKNELLLAVVTAATKLENLSSEKQEELRDSIDGVCEMDQDGNVNKAVANYNGISVQDLINSPNMAFLIQQWRMVHLNKAVNVMKNFGFEENEAWAMLLAEELELA